MKEKLIEKLELIYLGNKNAISDVISYFEKQNDLVNIYLNQLHNLFNQSEEEIHKYKDIIRKIDEYARNNSIYYPMGNGYQWIDQFKILDITNPIIKEWEIKEEI